MREGVIAQWGTIEGLQSAVIVLGGISCGAIVWGGQLSRGEISGYLLQHTKLLISIIEENKRFSFKR